MTFTTVQVANAAASMVLPRAHREDCGQTGIRSGVTMATHGAYSIFTSGPAALHIDRALELLAHLDAEFAGTTVDLEDAQMRRWVGADLARYSDTRPSSDPLLCGCSQGIVLCLGGSPCIWDPKTEMLRAADIGERLSAPPLTAYSFGDRHNVLQRVLAGLDFQTVAIRKQAGASANPQDVAAWTGRAFLQGSRVAEQSSMDRAEFLGAAVAALYAGYRVTAAMEAGLGPLPTQIHIARYGMHPTQKDVFSDISVPSATSVKRLRDRVQSICERPLAAGGSPTTGRARRINESIAL